MLGANLNAVALPQTDIPLKPEELDAARTKGIGTTALVFAIINVALRPRGGAAREGRRSQRRRCRRHGRALCGRRHEQPAVGAGPAGADSVPTQLDGVDLVKLLLAKGANPNARLQRQAAQASPRRRLDAELRRGHDAADARGADQRRGGR